MSDATCARPGCVRLTAAKHGFCLPDWRSIPLDVQRAIWRSYREHDADVHADFLRRLGERLNLISGVAPWPSASPSERMLTTCGVLPQPGEGTLPCTKHSGHRTPHAFGPLDPDVGLAYFDEGDQRWRCLHCGVLLDPDGECRCPSE